MKIVTTFTVVAISIYSASLLMLGTRKTPMENARPAVARASVLSDRFSPHSVAVQQNSLASAKPSVSLPPDESDYLAGIRAAGLNKDGSRLSDMIACLKSIDPASVATGLHALAHLGNKQAIPDVERVINSFPADYIRAEAKSTRARLLAEDAGRSVAMPNDRATVKVTKLLSEEKMDDVALNTGVTAFYTSPSGSQGLPHEVDALRELADIAYRETDASYLSLPLVQKFNFSQDPGAALKIKLAAMPEKTRVAWMIDELAHKTKLGKDDALLTQLAVDEGKVASHQAAVKLTAMDTQRDQYTYTGFSALFDVLRGVGDTEQAPTVEHFLNDKDSWVAYYARQVYPDVQRGLRRQYAIGY